MRVNNRHDMTLAVKVALIPNTTKQSRPGWGKISFRRIFASHLC